MELHGRVPLLMDSPCMVAVRGRVYLLGGRDTAGEALPYGLVWTGRDAAGPGPDKWTAFDLGDAGPRFGAACAVVQESGNRPVIWLVGGSK